MSLVPPTPIRLAILPDFPEEGWPSMDLCAEALLSHSWDDQDRFELTRCVPKFLRPFQFLGRRGFTLDRAYNRYLRYPKYARRIAGDYDFYHIVDHSYAHLVHSLPAERTGIYCHDLDAFRSLLEPERERRGVVFRRLMGWVLAGLQRAAIVFATSRQTADQLHQSGLIDADRIVYAPLGTAVEYQPSERPPELATIVHVGSCIPRKRVDVLLRVVARLRERFPGLKLLKIGGEWSPQHQQLIAEQNLSPVLEHRHNLSRTELAAVYQRASVVLVTSESEGFGLPVIEALACGAAVVASDIPPLREGGGTAIHYAPVGEVDAWVQVVEAILRNSSHGPDRSARLAQAARFSWDRHAEILLSHYAARMPAPKLPPGE